MVRPSNDPADILAALDALLGDPAFQASARNKQFLRFVVEETLAGRGDRIKSYTIAVDVFGRPPNFDASVDPIVRIEASRLRTALSNYYASVTAEIEISLPKGGYVPAFTWTGQMASPLHEDETPVAEDRDKPAPVSSAKPRASLERWPLSPRPYDNEGTRHTARRPSVIGRLVARISRPFGPKTTMQMPIVFVDAVEPLADDATTVLLARTLSQSMVSALGRYDGIAVSRKPPGGKQAVGKLIDANPDRLIYRLSSEVQIGQSTVYLWWYLSDMRTMEVYRSAHEEGPWRSLSETMVEAEIAEKVAAAIAHRNGFINALVARSFPDVPPPGYPSVVRAQRYTMTLDPASFPVVRKALEKTVDENPDYAEAWAYLAYFYADETRHSYDTPRSHEQSIALARDAAHHALRLAPYSALTYLALMVVEFQAGNHEAFDDAARRALELSPTDPKMLILAGNRFWAIGRREEGRAMVQRGLDIARMPGPMDALVLAFDDYVNGDYHTALSRLRRIPDEVYYVPMMAAACYGQLGDLVSAQSQIRRLLEVRPTFAGEMHAKFRDWQFAASISASIADGLGKAGFPPPDADR